MAPLGEFGWLVVAVICAAAVIGCLHTLAIRLRNELLVHDRRIECARLRFEYLERLRQLNEQE